MAEAFAAGISPDVFLDLTYREVYAVFAGRQLVVRRSYQLALYEAWHAAAFYRSKKMPELNPLLRKLEASRVLSPKAMRAAIIGTARALGASVRYVKKGEL